MNPADYPIGSLESRAAARVLLERKQQIGSCGCKYVVRVCDGVVEVGAEPIVKCAHHATVPLTVTEIERDRAAIQANFPLSSDGAGMTIAFVPRPF